MYASALAGAGSVLEGARWGGAVIVTAISKIWPRPAKLDAWSTFLGWAATVAAAN